MRGGRKLGEDGLHHAVEIPIDIPVGRSRDPITLCVQESGALERRGAIPYRWNALRNRSRR
jgi:hypothetical protein